MTAVLALPPGDPLHNGNGQARTCGAKTRKGGRCKTAAMANGRCRMHGGTAPTGPASHAWRHGRYSKYMPKHLLERAVELSEDPDVLSLVPNLIAIDAQVAEVYKALAEPERAEAWDHLHQLVERMRGAIRDKDVGAMTLAFIELEQLDRTGRSTLDLGEQLRRLHETRRRLVDTEAKRLSNEHAAVSYDRALGVVLMLVDVMFRHVTDTKTRRRIMDDVRALELGKGHVEVEER